MPLAAHFAEILDELFFSTLLVLATVAIHSLGLTVLTRMLRLESSEERQLHVPVYSLRTLLFTQGVVLALFVLHGLEIWLHALVFWWLGAIPDLSAAVYFSTISYSSLGYNDLVIAQQWRLLGAIEGITGLLMIGWSTAFFVTVVAQFNRR